jgi:hypothetical protein
MSVLSSPSPTLSPKPAFSHDRPSFTSLRRSSSHRSYRLSTSSSQDFRSHVSSPATSIHTIASQQTPTSAPTSTPKKRAIGDRLSLEKAASVDAGTQYTPPDYPPTAASSMSSASSAHGEATTTSIDTDDIIKTEEEALEWADPHSSRPSGPALGQDPQPRTPTGTLSGSAPLSNASGASSEILSPTKRARGEASAKVMPTDYMKCEVRDLGIVIADMLMELIRINDPLPVRNDQLTRYHSR